MANEEDDGGSPPTGSPPPVRRNALEEELGALLTSSESLQDQTRAANKDLLRMKRRSREISGEIEGMILQFEQASRLWASLGGLAGGDPKDLSDAALREAFDGIDADKSGKIDMQELREALKLAKQGATDEEIDDLIALADKDGDGEIDFEEYTAIVRGQVAN